MKQSCQGFFAANQVPAEQVQFEWWQVGSAAFHTPVNLDGLYLGIHPLAIVLGLPGLRNERHWTIFRGRLMDTF